MMCANQISVCLFFFVADSKSIITEFTRLTTKIPVPTHFFFFSS